MSRSRPVDVNVNARKCEYCMIYNISINSNDSKQCVIYFSV